MNPRFLFMGGFVITVGVISYYEVKECHDLPWPPRIVATGAVFALLDAFSFFSPELSGVIAIGFMLAMVVNTKLNASVNCDPTKKGCPCASQASDMVGIPPPNIIPPNQRNAPQEPRNPFTPIEPPGSTPLEPVPIIPELPAI